MTIRNIFTLLALLLSVSQAHANLGDGDGGGPTPIPNFGPQWTAIGGQYKAFKPSVINWGNIIIVYGVGIDDVLYSNTSNDTAATWVGIQGFGGHLASEASCYEETINLKPGVGCYALGHEKSIWHEFINYENVGSPQGEAWSSLGGQVASGVSVTYHSDSSWFGKRIAVVYARGLDNAIWVASAPIESPLQNWSSLGGGITSSPMCITYMGMEDCYASASDNALWENYQRPTSPGPVIPGVNPIIWNGFNSLGGQILGGASAMTLTQNRGLSLAVRGIDSKLYMRSYSSTAKSWGNWEGIGKAVVASEPVCTPITSTLNACFAILNNGQLGVIKFK